MRRALWTRFSARGTVCCLLLLGAACGCEPKAPQAAPAETPVVPISQPIRRQVTDYAYFTGRADAVHSVNIIPRVTGYLVKMPFKEGSEVKKGDLLFEVDPRPYQFQFSQQESQVTLAQAQLELAKTTLARYQALDKSTPGAVSKQALDQYRAAVDEAVARVEAQKKSLEIYRLNREFTQVTSPIDGQVSRYYLTIGNLVNQDQTLLTTVVSLDPMYGYFDMDERTLLQIRHAIRDGEITPRAGGDIPVDMGLQTEADFPHKGSINFVNNQVNSTTGSITMRGVFVNPKLLPQEASAGAAGSKESSGEKESSTSADISRIGRLAPRLLSPGMFLRIRLPIGQPHPALLVIDRAIQADQDRKFVYVVDAQNKAQTRQVKTGALQDDGLRVVTGEIKPDDWVVVGAMQQVRLRMEVRPDKVAMPTLLGGSGSNETAGQSKNGKSKAGKASQPKSSQP